MLYCNSLLLRDDNFAYNELIEIIMICRKFRNKTFEDNIFPLCVVVDKIQGIRFISKTPASEVFCRLTKAMRET